MEAGSELEDDDTITTEELDEETDLLLSTTPWHEARAKIVAKANDMDTLFFMPQILL